MSGNLMNPLTGLPIDDTSLEELSSLVEQQATLEDRIEKGEALLKDLKSQHLKLSTELIPDKLSSLGLSSITTANGRKVVVKPFYSCKILSPEAFKWLDEHGHGGIIKTVVEKKFTRDERDEALQFASEHPGFELSESVHHQTLTAFAKEIYSDNGQLPDGLFSVYQGSRTKLS